MLGTLHSAKKSSKTDLDSVATNVGTVRFVFQLNEQRKESI